jgi:hypothetical protein
MGDMTPDNAGQTVLTRLNALIVSPLPWYSYNVTLNNVRDALIRDGENIVVARLNGDHFLNDAAYAVLAVNHLRRQVAALEYTKSFAHAGHGGAESRSVPREQCPLQPCVTIRTTLAALAADLDKMEE